MVRINLLPIKEIKKRQQALSQVVGFALSIIALFVVLGLVGFGQTMKTNSLNNSIASLQKEKNSYQSTINEIEKLKEKKAKLDTKLSMIIKLKKGSQITVRILDEIASLTPANRLWLKSLVQSSSQLQITGVALDNETVAQYMKRLKASQYFSDAELANSSLTMIADRKLKAFSLTCNLALAQAEEPSSDEKSAKKT